MFDTEQQNKISDLRSRISSYKNEKTEIDRQIAQAEHDLKMALAEDNFYKFMVEALSREKICEFFSNMDSTVIERFVNGFEWRMQDMIDNAVPSIRKLDRNSSLAVGTKTVERVVTRDSDSVSDNTVQTDVPEKALTESSDDSLEKLFGFAKEVSADMVPDDVSALKTTSANSRHGGLGNLNQALDAIASKPAYFGKKGDKKADKLDLPKGFSSFGKKN